MVLALVASLLVVLPDSARAQDSSLCEHQAPTRLQFEAPLPVKPCYNGELDTLTLENTSTVWVKVSLPPGASIPTGDYTRAQISDQAVADLFDLKTRGHIPPGGRLTFDILPVDDDEISFSVQPLQRYTVISAIVKLLPYNWLATADNAQSLLQELTDSFEEYRRCEEDASNHFAAVWCRKKLEYSASFSLAESVGPEFAKGWLSVFLGGVDSLQEVYAAAADHYLYDIASALEVATPDADSDTGDGEDDDETAGNGGDTGPTIPVADDACSPPVPSGHRGVADTTNFADDPCSGVFIRDGTNLSNAVVGSMPQGRVFEITCQERGQPISDSRGQSSDVWNRVSVDGANGFVQDTWSGQKGWLDIPCNSTRTAPVGGCDPAVPSGARGIADTTEWDRDPCSGVFLRSGPANHNTVSRDIPQGTVFDINCQVRGQTITDDRGNASDVWNKTSYDGISGYVADTWSGQKGWLDRPCSEPTGCNPEVPGGNRGVADTTEFDDDPCSGAYLREGTQLDATVLREIEQGRVFDIHCQRRGEPVRDSRAYESDVWNKTSIEGTVGWVQDIWSGRKGWLELSCDATPPDAPQAPSTSLDDAAATVSWSAPDSNGGKIVSYDVRVETDNGDHVRTVAADRPKVTVDGLNNGTGYRFKVRAHNHKGAGGWSPWSQAATPVGLPWDAGPPSLSIVDGDLHVKWIWASPADNGSPLQNFDVELRDVKDDTVEHLTVDRGVSSFTWRNSQEGHQYEARIRGNNAVGAGEWSVWSEPISLPARPEAVDDVQRNASADGIELDWSPVNSTTGAPVDGYEITTSSGTDVTETSSTTATIQGLDATDDEVLIRATVDGVKGPATAVAIPKPRVAGADRFATAARLSAQRFDPGVEVAYVATGLKFADALTGGVAAAADAAPLLLAASDTIPESTAVELARLDPERVVLLGGPAALSEQLQERIAAFVDGDVSRLAGSNRFATAAAVSSATFGPEPDIVYVGTGSNFPDVLAGGPPAAAADGPLLLAARNTLPSATARELDRMDPQRIVLLGGQNAISESVEQQLATYAQVERLGGTDRFATAAQIVKNEFPDSSAVDGVYVATGFNFADALAASAVAGAESVPVILVAYDSVPPPMASQIERLDPDHVWVMGGTAAVSEPVEAQLRQLAKGS